MRGVINSTAQIVQVLHDALYKVALPWLVVTAPIILVVCAGQNRKQCERCVGGVGEVVREGKG